MDSIGGVRGYWLTESGDPLEEKALSSVAARAARLFAGDAAHPPVALLRSPLFEINLALVLAAMRAGAPCALADPESPEMVDIGGLLTTLGEPVEIYEGESGTQLRLKHGNATPLDLAERLGEPDTAPPSPPYAWRNDQTAFVLFTTGSTGKPKGVCHSLGNLLRSAQLFVAHFGLQAGDRLLSVAPLHTMSGLRALLIPCVAEIGVAFSAARDLGDILDALATSKATHLLCGPQAVQVLARLGRRLTVFAPRLKWVLCTGAWLDENERATLERETPVRVLNYYGLTETCGLVLGETPADRRPGRLPPPCAGTGIELLPTDDPGVHELRIRAPNLFLGYLGEPLRRCDGFASGDLARLDDNGQLELLGRKSQAVKAPSTRLIHPLCLENWLRRRPGVMDAVVDGVERPGGGYLAARVALAPEIPEDAWRTATEAAICAELGREYLPQWTQAAPPPRTTLGKIRKNRGAAESARPTS